MKHNVPISTNDDSKLSGARMIRLGHPMAFCALLRRIGAPTERYLRHAGLPVQRRAPDTLVPLTKVWTFINTAATANDPSLGWLVGENVGEHNLSASLLYKLDMAPSLLQALRWFLRSAKDEATHIQLGMYEREADVLIYTHYAGKSEVPGYHVAQAYQLGVIIGVIRHFQGPHWMPEEIGIEQQTTPADVAKIYPGCRIMARQSAGYIAVPRTCLHNTSRRGTGKSAVAGEQVLHGEADFRQTLCRALNTCLPDGYPSARFSAALMGISTRTLARKLAPYGQTYGQLVDEVRFVEAKKLLQNPQMEIGDVATRVGFDDQRNFARMFRRVGGLSPTDFQKMILS